MTIDHHGACPDPGQVHPATPTNHARAAGCLSTCHRDLPPCQTRRARAAGLETTPGACLDRSWRAAHLYMRTKNASRLLIAAHSTFSPPTRSGHAGPPSPSGRLQGWGRAHLRLSAPRANSRCGILQEPELLRRAAPRARSSMLRPADPPWNEQRAGAPAPGMHATPMAFLALLLCIPGQWLIRVMLRELHFCSRRSTLTPTLLSLSRLVLA